MNGLAKTRRCLSALWGNALWVPALALGLACGMSGCALSRLDHRLDRVPPSAAASFRTRPGDRLVPAGVPAAKPVAMTESLDLARCIQVALANRPETRETWLALRAAAAAVGRARSAYLPSLDLSAQAAVGDPLGPSNPPATGVGYGLQAGLALRYLLLDGGARAAGVAATRASLVAAGLGHNARLRDVVRSVELAYYALLAARQQQSIAHESVTQAKEHVAFAQARRASDMALRLDVLQARTARAQATLESVRARSRVRLERGRLAHAMGLSPTAPLRVAAWPPEVPRHASRRIRALLDEAAAQRPELAAALARVRRADAQIEAARSRYWPAVAFSAQAGLQLWSASPRYTFWSMGLELTVPLFDGMDREYAIRQARLEAERSVATVAGLGRDIELQVWTAFVALKEAGEAIHAARALVQSATESARTAAGQYRAGAASIIALMDAETVRVQARLRLVQARLAWYASLAELRWAVGRLRGAGQGTAPAHREGGSER